MQLGSVSAIDVEGRTIWIVSAHGYGKFESEWDRLSLRNCLQGASNFGTFVKSTREV